MFNNTGTFAVALYNFKGSIVCVCVCVCMCVFKFSETTGPTEAKFHVEPPWDR